MPRLDEIEEALDVCIGDTHGKELCMFYGITIDLDCDETSEIIMQRLSDLTPSEMWADLLDACETLNLAIEL